VSETCRVLINQVKQAASRWLFTYTILTIVLQLPTVFSTVTCCTGL